MKLFSKASDGGANSGVTGYFVIEIKWLFSIVLLRFEKGTREAFHEHAFNAVTLWLKGRVREHLRHAMMDIYAPGGCSCPFFKAGDFKRTPRSAFHKIEALEETWALSVRGPWLDHWREDRRGRLVTLTHGRREIA